MTRSQFLKIILVAALVLVSLVFGITQSVGASRTTGSLTASDDTATASETTCMNCHQTQGAISQIQQLTYEGRNMRPAWSPDGQKVAFYSNRTGNDDIWMIDLENSEEVQLTTDPADDRRPNWRPDGAWIAFDSDRSGNRDIWIIGADGSGLKQLTSSPRDELFASWSPDGERIAFFSYGSGTNELWVMDADGANPSPVVSKLASVQAQQCSFACHQPSWNQSGKKLAFHSERSGNRDIWIVNADGTELTRLTTGAAEDYFPSWTPDGRIVFMTERVGPRKAWNDVRVINADGTQATTLFTEVAHGGPLYWSPEGNRIALHSKRTGDDFNIFIATIGEPPGPEPASGAPAVDSQPADSADSQPADSPAIGAEAAEAEAAPAESATSWHLWLGAVAAVAVIVALVGLGTIAAYLWRAGAR